MWHRKYRYRFLYLALALAFLLVIYRDFFNTALFFDVHAPDLAGRGIWVRDQLLIGSFSYTAASFEFFSYASVFLPLAICLTGYDYLNIRDRHLVFSIGKNPLYFRKLRVLKWQTAGISMGIYALVFGIVILVALLFGSFSMDRVPELFSKHSILQFFLQSDFHYGLFLLGSGIIATAINALFFFQLLDHVKSYAIGVVLYLGILWFGSILLYYLLPFYLVPMSTFMISAYGKLNLWLCAAPYLPYAMGCVFLSRLPYEVSA